MLQATSFLELLITTEGAIMYENIIAVYLQDDF